MIVDNLIRGKIPFAILMYRKCLLIDRSMSCNNYTVTISQEDAAKAKDVRFARGRIEDGESDLVSMLELTRGEEMDLLDKGTLNKLKLVKNEKTGKVWEFKQFKRYIETKKNNNQYDNEKESKRNNKG